MGARRVAVMVVSLACFVAIAACTASSPCGPAPEPAPPLDPICDRITSGCRICGDAGCPRFCGVGTCSRCNEERREWTTVYVDCFCPDAGPDAP